jgi:hypothetical protein
METLVNRISRRIEERLTWLAEDFRAKTSVLPDAKQELVKKHGVVCSMNLLELSKKFRHDMLYLRIVRMSEIIQSSDEILKKNGYSLAQFNVNASQFGFIHRRERVYGVAANTARDGCSISGKIKDVADIFNEVLKKTKTSPSQLHLSNVWHTPIAKYIQYDDGLSAGVVKSEIHAFGNAIVPIIPYVFFEILKEI